MDALGGYGSSSSSEGEEEKTRAPALATAASRRGKKILSLASVLPPHILDQLTKQADDADSIGSSSSDDGDDGGRNRKETQSQIFCRQRQSSPRPRDFLAADRFEKGSTGTRPTAATANEACGGGTAIATGGCLSHLRHHHHFE